MELPATRSAFTGRLALLLGALAGLAFGHHAPAQPTASAPMTVPPPPSLLPDPVADAPVARDPVAGDWVPGDPRVTSPYAGPPPTLRRATEDFLIDTGDEPLWVLPPELIPPGVLVGADGGLPRGPSPIDDAAAGRGGRARPATVPFGASARDPVRIPGYLDTPDSIHRAGRHPDELIDGRLHDGLPWAFCGPRPPRLGPAPMATPLPDTTPIDVDTGGLSYAQDTDLLMLRGGVVLDRAGQRVTAPAIDYHRPSGDVVTAGETLIDFPGLRIIGSGAEMNLEGQRGTIFNARYRFTDSMNVRGDAAVADVVNPRLTRYTDITYTACRPGVNAWSMRARDLELDQDSGRGVARHARLRIGPVPVLYTPYINFPIDDRRKSGFLIPSVGVSSDNGFELLTPYYWNIAPQLDATFYPRIMSERGLMLGGELRYLTRRDTGTIQAEILPNDDKFDDGGSRWAVHLEQSGAYAGRWSTNLDFSAVSDDDYLRDFGTSLDVTSARWLTQRGDLTYAGNGWFLLSRLEAFQTIDPNTVPTGRPYGRLPQVQFGMTPQPLGYGLVGTAAAEYTWFDHNHLVDGQRLALAPSLALPLRRSYGHLIPGLQLNLSSYALTDAAPGQDTNPGHAIPTFDLDGRLVFERPQDWFGRPGVQTLEPRLYYLYTPYVDQDETPVFDSAALDFSFANLFRSNRFTGRDRIGDANQVTVGLTSRLLAADTGIERLRLSVGQILYFSDRRVQANPATPDATTDRSPIAGELAAQLTANWSGRASIEWDPEADDEQWGRRTLALQYRTPEADRLLNLAYRYDQGTGLGDRFDDADLSFRLGLGEAVGVVGRWLYSFEQETTTDAFAGIEFGQCCWKLRILGRHSSNGIDQESDNSVMLQLELAGLGALGSPVNRFLAEEIYGYQIE